MITQIFNQNILKILTIFSISPGSRFLRNDLKEKAKLNNSTLDDSLNVLFSANILKKERKLISFNIEYKSLIELIKKDHQYLNELYTPAYFSIIDIVYHLSKFKHIEAHLFGSHSKLIHNEKSDIDIAIISNSFNQKNKDNILKFINKVERRYKKPIELHYFTNDFYKNKRDPLVKDILKNGRRLI